MGDVILMRDHGKRVRADPIEIDDDRLVAAVEQQIAEQNPQGGWRLRKKLPKERHDLIVMARNLAVMREALPHGEKSRVLLNADFSGADHANVGTYANNLMLSPSIGTPTTDRLRRLSPKVQRYVDVATAIEGDRKRGLARLFRRTSFDRDFSGDWQGNLSARLDRLAAEIAAETGLARYFDELSAANVCLADGDDRSLRTTAWLSETFHKDDFAEARSEHPDGTWLYDRHEEGTPRAGAPLVVPMVPIDVRSRSWMVRRKGGDSRELSCSFSITLHIAIVPIAASLNEPCRVECWLIERPAAEIRSLRVPVEGVSVGVPDVNIRAGEGVYEPIDDAGFRAWSLTEEGRLLVAQVDARSLQSDLSDGGWWCMSATTSAVHRRLSSPRAGGRSLVATHARDLATIIDHLDDLEEIDLHSMASDLYPPQGSLALELAFGLDDLKQKLRLRAEEMVWSFRTFQQQLRSASPLAK